MQSFNLVSIEENETYGLVAHGMFSYQYKYNGPTDKQKTWKKKR